jgi:hypothetical protein
MPDVFCQLATSETNAKKWGGILLYDPRFGGFLDGWASWGATGGNLFTLARSGHPQLVEKAEVIRGIECRRVDAKGDTWAMKLWVAPSKEFNLVKLELVGTQPGVFEKYAISIEVDEYGTHDGRSLPVSARHVAAYTPSPHSNVGYTSPYRFEHVAKRTLIDLNPSFPENIFSFAGIKDGTKVRIEEEPNASIALVWQDGKPRKRVDGEKLASLDAAVAEAPAVNGGTERLGRVWLWVLAGFVAVAMAGWLIVRKRIASHAPVRVSPHR